MFAAVVVILFALILIAGGWALVCNERTYRDRGKIIDAICNYNLSKIHVGANLAEVSRENVETWDLFKEVTYRQHTMYRMYFKDPMQLYDEKIRGLMTRKTLDLA